jgi:hypothetical protein
MRLCLTIRHLPKRKPVENFDGLEQAPHKHSMNTAPHTHALLRIKPVLGDA